MSRSSSRRVAGLDRTLLVGGAFTAVIVGLAAQQTLGSLFAGMVLLGGPSASANACAFRAAGSRPARRVVSSLGLLYTTFARGDDQIMIPNSVVLNVAIVPREPDGVDLRAPQRRVTPLEFSNCSKRQSRRPSRPPQIHLEKSTATRSSCIPATPEHSADGPSWPARCSTRSRAAIALYP